MIKEQRKELIETVIQLLLGLVFIVSGVLKSMDIYGTELKFIEYGNSLGWDFLVDYNMPLSIALCAFEISLGILLCTFLFQRIALRILTVTMAVFTAITLFFVIFPEKGITDCGCFGELLPMSMMASLIKNIVMLSLSYYLLKTIWYIEFLSWWHFILIYIVFFSASLFLPWYTAKDLSFYNPTGYGVGCNLKDKEAIILLDKNYEDVTNKVLSSSKRVYVFVLKHKPSSLETFRIHSVMDECRITGARCFALSSEDMELPTGLSHYYVDEVLLKSLVRSHNNGKITLRNGVVENVIELTDKYYY